MRVSEKTIDNFGLGSQMFVRFAGFRLALIVPRKQGWSEHDGQVRNIHFVEGGLLRYTMEELAQVLQSGPVIWG